VVMPSVASVRRLQWAVARPQLSVMAAQWIGGLGNLAFAVILARVLEPAAYADMAAFLGVYLLVSVPGAALSAAGALDPAQLAALANRIGAAATLVGAALVAASGPLARMLGGDRGIVVALGLAVPAAAVLGTQRGIAYGNRHHRGIAASLAAEPAVRIATGIPLAALAGPAGAALATALAGYAAVAALAAGRPAVPATVLPPAPLGAALRRVLPVALPFLLIAVFQTADLLVANRVLGRQAAAEFGALSTIGGAAVFATATIPLVLLPSLRRSADGKGATFTATSLAAVVGVSVALGLTLVAGPFVRATFGGDYAGITHLVGPYLLAMALLAVLRVRLAQWAAGPRVRWASAVVLAAAVVQVAAVAGFARSPAAVVGVTLATTVGLAVVLELPTLSSTAPGVAAVAWLRRRRTEVAVLAALCSGAIAVRLATSRGLWVDEAISVQQAQLPFGQMLADMRFTDVHPPFHHALLWVTVRVLGTSELAVRTPSLLAGVALVPAMYWVGRTVYDRRTGWVAAAMAAVAPFCVWYSQEARMYSQFMLLAAIAVGAQVLAIRRGARRDWLLYGLSTAALLWTQYFAVLPIAVQQAGFAAALWSRRADRSARKRLLLGWLGSSLVIVIALAPMLPLLRDQLVAYGNRGGQGLVPGQAGAGNSNFGDTISVYALGANLIWAVVGYHADELMVQIAAFWPALMLAALILLGRGRAKVSMLLLGLIVVPLAALLAVGSVKRDLFELRYFSGAVPVLLLLVARFATATARRTAAVAVTAALFIGAMTVGLVDQQLNGANPRLYDFEGAFDRIHAGVQPGDVVLFEPAYLAEVVAYYAPDLEAHPVGSPITAGTSVWVLATDRIVNAEQSSAQLGSELSRLGQSREQVQRFSLPNVRVWELRP